MPWSPIAKERPDWMRVKAAGVDSRFQELTQIVRENGLHTVCEEAGCPNIGECWGVAPRPSRSWATPARAPAATAR